MNHETSHGGNMRKGLTTQQIIDKVQDGDYVGVTPCIPLTPEERERAQRRAKGRRARGPFVHPLLRARARSLAVPLWGIAGVIVAWLLCAIAWSYLR
jgi:hypothetical protein